MAYTESGLSFSCVQFIASDKLPTHVRRFVEIGALSLTTVSCGGVCNVALQIMIDEMQGQDIGCVGPNDPSCPRSSTNEIILHVE